MRYLFFLSLLLFAAYPAKAQQSPVKKTSPLSLSTLFEESPLIFRQYTGRVSERKIRLTPAFEEVSSIRTGSARFQANRFLSASGSWNFVCSYPDLINVKRLEFPKEKLTAIHLWCSSKSHQNLTVYASHRFIKSFERGISIGNTLKFESGATDFVLASLLVSLMVDKKATGNWLKYSTLLLQRYFKIVGQLLLRGHLEIDSQCTSVPPRLEAVAKAAKRFTATFRVLKGYSPVPLLKKNAYLFKSIRAQMGTSFKASFDYLKAIQCRGKLSRSQLVRRFKNMMTMNVLKEFSKFRKKATAPAPRLPLPRESSQPKHLYTFSPRKGKSAFTDEDRTLTALLKQAGWTTLWLILPVLGICALFYLIRLLLGILSNFAGNLDSHFARVEASHRENERKFKIRTELNGALQFGDLEEFFSSAEQEEINHIKNSLHHMGPGALKNSLTRVQKIRSTATSRKEAKGHVEALQNRIQTEKEKEHEAKLKSPKRDEEAEQEKLLALIKKITHEALPIPLPHPPSSLKELFPILDTKLEELPETNKKVDRLRREYQQLVKEGPSLPPHRAASKLEHLWNGISQVS